MMGSKSDGTKSRFLRHWDWIALTAVIILIAVVRVRLLSIPLERDEGEYAYMGQLMLHGIPPYKLACNMKFPGTYIAYAVIMGLFGQTIRGIHLGLLIVNAISIVLVFLLGRRVLGRLGAVVAAATFALMSVHPSVNGTSAHATQFAVPFIVGGFLIMLQSLDAGKPMRLIWCGILLGMATLVKQHAAIYLLFCIPYCIWTLRTRGKRLAGSLYPVLGAAIPVLATFAWLSAAGVFHEFWFWTIRYAREYVSQASFSVGVANVKATTALFSRSWLWLLWMLAGMGVVMLWSNRFVHGKPAFLLGLLVFSLLAVSPGLHFRNHYFVLMLPAVALFVGVAVVSAREKLARMSPLVSHIPLIAFACAWLAVMLASGSFFFRLSPVLACRAMYFANPFPEAVEVADYIKSHSSESDEIAVLGSEPEIYFYADRRSATGFIYMYSLTEKQKYAPEMRRRLTREIETRKPRYLVYVNLRDSWLDTKSTDYQQILKWAESYALAHYRLVGMVDLLGEDYWSEAWGPAAEDYTPSTMNFVCVFERLPG